jgi:hypothetical protein
MASERRQPDNPAWWEQVRSNPLGREISIALVGKLVLLALVWWIFFSEPIDRDLDHHAVEQVLLAPASPKAIVPVTQPDQRHPVIRND